MTGISEILKLTINSELKRIKGSFPADSYYAIQILIRRLDVVGMFFWKSEHQNEEQINESREFFNFGWAPIIKLFFDDLDFHKLRPFIQTKKEDYAWADSVMLSSGKLAFCRQILDYEKAKVLEITNAKKNEFEIKYKSNQVGVEYFERLSADFFRDQIVEKIINERKSKLSFSEKEIKEKLRAIIKNPYGKFISYETTPEIDEYYNALGHHRVLQMPVRDDFSEADTFGSIEYGKYVDLIEIITGVAIMHIDACIELTKMNSSVDMHNILTYTYFKDKTIRLYSDFLGASEEEIEQIFSCITVSKDNYKHYLDTTAAVPPMYFQISDNQLSRSVVGCTGNPFRILNSELKRRYARDYDIAANKREERFRKELFFFFPHERIVKIPKEINISFNGIKTDIDAIAYDTVTKTLGLFQLKWQDPFAHSMKERFSRISNLFPKANEWIAKMKLWLSSNDEKTILNALQITKYAPRASEINDICVFVLARNHIHFTGVETDESVAWGSWYQIIESEASIETRFDDPIREMFVKLKMFSPEHRMTREEMPQRQNFDVRLGDYRVYYNE